MWFGVRLLGAWCCLVFGGVGVWCWCVLGFGFWEVDGCGELKFEFQFQLGWILVFVRRLVPKKSTPPSDLFFASKQANQSHHTNNLHRMVHPGTPHWYWLYEESTYGRISTSVDVEVSARGVPSAFLRVFRCWRCATYCYVTGSENYGPPEDRRHWWLRLLAAWLAACLRWRVGERLVLLLLSLEIICHHVNIVFSQWLSYFQDKSIHNAP